jgi:hypothetical protein
MAPPHRCPVGPDSPASARCPPTPEGRAAARRRSALLRGDSLGAVDRGTLERTPHAIWQCQHLLAAAPAVGSQRGAAGAVAGLAGPAQ